MLVTKNVKSLRLYIYIIHHVYVIPRTTIDDKYILEFISIICTVGVNSRCIPTDLSSRDLFSLKICPLLFYRVRSVLLHNIK